MKTKIELAIEALAAECGYPNPTCGESGTEYFLERLIGAARRTKKEVTRSHKQGLCLNTFPVLARELEKPVLEIPVVDCGTC